MKLEDNVLLAKRSIIDCIWKQAHLEGIPVTFPDTYAICEGDYVDKMKATDVVAINNLKHGWWFILDNLNETTDIAFTKQLNSTLGANLFPSAGQIRNFSMTIGGTSKPLEMPDSNVADGVIRDLQANVADAQERALDIFCYLCRAQLFPDGNKRTATLIANKELIAGGAGIMAIPIGKILEFTQLLIKFYESNNPDDLKSFLKAYAITNEQTLERDAISSRHEAAR